MDTERNLLFGVLTLQAELIDSNRFAEACTPWARKKQVALSELFVRCGWITRSHCIDVERTMERELRRHGGDVRATLAAVASENVSESLESIEDPDLHRSFGIMIPPSPSELSTEHFTETRLASPRPLAKPRDPAARYTLARLHKEGGLSEVWVARDRDLNRDVALKKLQPRQAAYGESARRFIKEAQVTGQLEHPNIVPIYELVRTPDDQQPFYTMRFVRGQNLRQVIKSYHERRQQGNVDPLELPRLLRAFISVCNAIGYSHSRGVVHRDLKPENVVVGEFGEVMVLDWGLAKLMDQPVTDSEITAQRPSVTEMVADDATTAGSIMGTPAYMAPEQVQGALVDYRSDIYGLGAILFTMLAGRPPRNVKNFGELMKRVAAGESPRARSIDPTVSPALDAICAKAMAKDRAARYAKASELADDIERYLADQPVSVSAETLPQRLARWARHHKNATAAAAVALFAVTVSSLAAMLLVNNARKSESIAKAEATERLRQARDAVDTMLTGVSDGLKDVPGAQKVRNQLLQRAMEAYEQFSEEKSDDNELQAESARALIRLADIRRTVGDYDGAVDASRSAESLFDKLSNQNSGAPSYLLGLARSRDQLGLALDSLGRPAEAEAAYSAAIATAQALVTEFPDPQSHPSYHDQLVHSRTGLGIVLAAMHRHADAERAYRTAISGAETLVRAYPAVPGFRNNLARSRANLANLLQLLDRPQHAEIEYRAAISDLEALLRTDPEAPGYRSRLAMTRSNLGALLNDCGRFEDAERNYRDAIENYDVLVNDNSAVPDYRAGLVAALQNLGHLLITQSKLEEAEESYRRATDAGARLIADQPNTPEYIELVGDACRHLGTLLRDLGPSRLTESLAALDSAVRMHQTLVDKNAHVAQYRQNLAASLQQRELTVAHMRRPATIGDATPLIAQAATSQDRPQAIRPLRSAASRRLTDIEIESPVQAEASKAYSNSKRLAVLPFLNTEHNAAISNEGIGFMEAMLADMRYVSHFLVLDGSEVLSLIRTDRAESMAVDLESAARVGQQLGAHCVVTGSFTVEVDQIRLSAQAIDCSSREFRVLASSEAVRPKAQICALSDEVIQELLKQMGSLPDPSILQEMSKIPTMNFQARAECDAGFALLAQAAASGATAARELTERALKHADAAVQFDANYVQAYILKASCFWNLERAADMEACLRAARIKSDPVLVDELTRFELEGDYAMFVERNFDKAIENYKKMLEIDAGHTRALLSLAGLYAGDFGAADTGIDDADAAAEYAARLIAAHPGSPIAASFQKVESKAVRPQED